MPIIWDVLRRSLSKLKEKYYFTQKKNATSGTRRTRRILNWKGNGWDTDKNNVWCETGEVNGTWDRFVFFIRPGLIKKRKRLFRVSKEEEVTSKNQTWMETSPDHVGIFCIEDVFFFCEIWYQVFIFGNCLSEINDFEDSAGLKYLKCLWTVNSEQSVMKFLQEAGKTKIFNFICLHCETRKERRTSRHYCFAFSPRPKSESVKVIQKSFQHEAWGNHDKLIVVSRKSTSKNKLDPFLVRFWESLTIRDLTATLSTQPEILKGERVKCLFQKQSRVKWIMRLVANATTLEFWRVLGQELHSTLRIS